MTYEQKAKELYERLFRTGPHLNSPVALDPLALITTALREAGNAKLEEALSHIAMDLIKGGASEEGANSWVRETRRAFEIRSLIEKD